MWSLNHKVKIFSTAFLHIVNVEKYQDYWLKKHFNNGKLYIFKLNFKKKLIIESLLGTLQCLFLKNLTKSDFFHKWFYNFTICSIHVSTKTSHILKSKREK